MIKHELESNDDVNPEEGMIELQIRAKDVKRYAHYGYVVSLVLFLRTISIADMSIVQLAVLPGVGEIERSTSRDFRMYVVLSLLVSSSVHC